jgi:TatD DNase family protein
MPAALRKLARRGEVAAIGECGLDYNRDYSPRHIQRRCFEAQLDLARELSLPLFLHERDAFDDFFAILRGNPGAGPGSVVHCFTGTEGELRAYLDLGCYIGITGWICDERRGRPLAELVKAIPPDRLLLETDAPFLIPRNLGEKVRGGRNEPKYLPHIAGVVAQCLGKPPEQVARETAENSRRFFRIP